MYRKTPMVLLSHKYDTAMDTAIMMWNRVISHTGLFQQIISFRDPKFTSALWTDINSFFGTKLSLSTAYHPQTDGLVEIIRKLVAYGLELKGSDSFTNDWCTLIPAVVLA
ncbi:hypothetical protein O181_082571 [Austropuccinia psidii MF-1]|uniref:Integrase catalytic domain-containing protein n=1 Tax=Austropuccinia psidii MF-1 TaxID=1389203 RepID=A0A9Q3FSV4_9BASI|nr:hypothetical protein [Austropuccinia psidii MF-1]